MVDPGSDEALERFRIPGGIDLFVYPIRKFKTTLVSILLHRSLDDQTAAAALVPFMLRRGTERLPNLAAISRHLELLFGAGLDVDVLRFGERQILSFRLDVVDDRYLVMGGRDLLRQGLSLLRDILLVPALENGSFPNDVFEQERLNLRRFVDRMVEDKARYALERCVNHMCGDEPYARFEYGELDEIDALTSAGVTDTWQEVLRTAPMEIYVVGSADPAVVRENVGEFFGGIRNGAVQFEDAVPGPVKARRARRVREANELVQARLVMGYRTEVGFGHRLSVPLTVMNTLFGGSPTSRLFRNVREKHSLAYYCNSSVDQAKGVAFVQAGIDGEKAQAVEKLVKRELTAVRQGRVGLEELRGAKAHITAGMLSLGDSPSRIAGFLQERQAAGAAGSVADALAEVSRVTRADVARAAKSLTLDTVYLLANRDE